jgi:hypothetical protein
MSGTPPDQLAERLARATAWTGDTPGLWAKALEADSKDRRARTIPDAATRLWRRPWARAAMFVLAGSILALVAASLAPPRPRVGGSASVASPPAQYEYSVNEQWRADQEGTSRAADRLARVPVEMSAAIAPSAAPASPPTPPPDAREPFPTDRVVIRKASIDLESKDVRAVAAKASLLVNEATGEYIESSTVTGGGGEGPARIPLNASLTLRVRSERLSDVLNRLRDLGAVTAENLDGQDVTTEAVDLDARLRNEQRVETELLELLGARTNAPLKDVLELREQIAKVREQIELLSARRDRLSHLASLATILVIVREPLATPDQPRPAALGGHLGESLDRAWTDGSRALVDSLAWLLRVLIAGAVWWIVVAVAATWAYRAARRNAQRQAAPTPSAPAPPPPIPSAHDPAP